MGTIQEFIWGCARLVVDDLLVYFCCAIMGRVKKVTVKKEVPAGNNSPQCNKALKGQNRKIKDTGEDDCWWRRINSKSQNIKKRNNTDAYDWGHMYSVIKKILPVNENITNKIEKLLPAAIDCVNVSIPKYMSYLLPLAINKIVPGPFAGVAYDVASETVVPYIVDKVIPNAVDSFLSEETRTNIAIEKSLRERRPSEFSEIEL